MQLQPPILATKLYAPPLRQSTLHRARLHGALDGILRHSLTLLSAPAGFGKTTVIGGWIAAQRIPSAWLSLDPRDGDLVRFLGYLLAALRSLLPEVGSSLDEHLAGGPLPPIERLLAPLINDLARADDEIVLVLDDYHEITSTDVHDALLFLIEHLPPKIHLVISTRVDPPFPLSRIRAGRGLVELRAEDLRFTGEEAEALCNDVLSLGLRGDHVEVLAARTEGWIAGIHLAALSIRGRGDVDRFITDFSGADRYVLGYLLEEVLGRQPEQLQSALLALSVLERFDARLCEHLTGVPSGVELLELLARENLFLVPLDATGEWYRYHHLFADLLRHRLGRVSPAVVPELHWKAAGWLEERGHLISALQHAEASGDRELLAGMLERHWRFAAACNEQESAMIDRMLATIPEERLTTGPRLPILSCWTPLQEHRFDEVDRLLAVAERSLDGALEDEGYFEALGQIYFARAVMARDRADARQTIELGEKALALLPERLTGPEAYQWNTSLGLIQAILGAAHEIAGDYRRAEELFEASLRFDRQTRHRQSILLALSNLGRHAAQKGKLSVADRALWEMRELDAADSYIVGMPVVPHQIAARLAFERFELDEALDALEAAINLPVRHVTTQLFDLLRLRALARAARGEHAEALESLHEMERLRISEPESRLARIAPALRALLALLADEPAAAAEWSQRNRHGAVDADAAPSTFMLRMFEDLIHARYLVAARRDDEAAALLADMREAYDRAGALSALAETLVLRAWLRWMRGEEEEAVDALEEALRATALEGVVRPFAMDLRRIAAPLALAAERVSGDASNRRHAERVAALAPSSVPSEPAVGERRRAAGPKLVEQLTAREVEILELIAEGHSNRKIAERLFVSVNTIKTHVAHLFEKLGASGRVEALIRARESRLID